MDSEPADKEPPKASRCGQYTRGALQAVGGAVPFAGGLLSAIAGAWSENEQVKVNQFIESWLRMLQDELREKEKTVVEIMARLDLNNEKIAERVESKEFQSLVKKTFREWAGAESEDKRTLIRNILANTAASTLTSDDVIRMFVDWVRMFSVLHFRRHNRTPSSSIPRRRKQREWQSRRQQVWRGCQSVSQEVVS
jgi:hypothetical protein